MVPDLAFRPEWGWGSSSQGNNNSYQDYFGVRSQIPDNMAFALFTQTTTVPEPGSLMLLGSGSLGAAGMPRLKFKG